MGSFADGFGMGQKLWNDAQLSKERALDRARQTTLDAQNTETHNLNLAAGKINLDNAQQKADDDKAMRAASQTAVAAPGEAIQDGDKTSMIANGTGQATLDQDKAERPEAYVNEDGTPKETAPTMVQSANVKAAGPASRAFLQSAGGLAAAQKYAEERNDPVAMAQRQVAVLRSQGKHTEADAAELAIEKHQSDLHDARTGLLERHGLEAITGGGGAALAQKLGTMPGGITLKHTPDANGGGVLTPMKDGVQAGTPIAYKNNTDLADKWSSFINPMAAQKMRQAAALKADDRNNTPHIIPAGGTLATAGKGVIATNNNGMVWNGEYNSDGSPTMVKAGVGGKKADHFDAKEWDHEFGKIDKSVISFPDDMGKEAPDPTGSLRQAYMSVFNAARAAGDVGPNQATEKATAAANNLKAASLEMVRVAREKDKKSTLTPGQAARQILQSYKPAAPAQAPSTGGAPPRAGYPVISPEEQRAKDSDATDVMRSELPKIQSDLAALGPRTEQNKDRFDRLTSDAAGVAREIGHMQTKVTPAAVPTSAAPAAQAAQAVVPQKSGRAIPHGEQQFANVAAKAGWQYYTSDYGLAGQTAYRKPDGQGGWIVKKAADVAKDLGVQY